MPSRFAGREAERRLLSALAESALYREYERAFSEATGLVLALAPVDSWQLPHHGKLHENRLCALMAQKSRSCAVCLRAQQRLTAAASESPRTVVCPVGLCDTAVPVRLGEHLIGFLQTGQVFLKRPTAKGFERLTCQGTQWSLPADAAELKRAYFSGRLLSARQHTAVVALLSIFAQHLALVSNQILVRHENRDSPLITRSKDFIHRHLGEDFTLGQAAAAAGTSRFHFCKLFKQATGLNFADYVARLRIEQAKQFLLNPNLRISEIAFQVGFQSLTHFNRVFRRIVGWSPTEYRHKLPAV